VNGAGPARLATSRCHRRSGRAVRPGEILLGRHDGAADLSDLADNLGLEVDELLPLVDALVLLGFAELTR